MTIKDLAALSGYSLGTVSRVLNNQPHVSEKAREQIMAIVKEQGFELNTNARNLKQTHSNNILVIVRGTHNELFAALSDTIATVLRGRVELGKYPMKPKPDALDAHDAVADAIAKGEPERARSAMLDIVDEVARALNFF